MGSQWIALLGFQQHQSTGLRHLDDREAFLWQPQVSRVHERSRQRPGHLVLNPLATESRMKYFGGSITAVGHGLADDAPIWVDGQESAANDLTGARRGEAAFEFVDRDDDFHAATIRWGSSRRTRRDSRSVPAATASAESSVSPQSVGHHQRPANDQCLREKRTEIRESKSSRGIQRQAGD